MSREHKEILTALFDWTREYTSLIDKLLLSCKEYKETMVYKKLLGKQEVLSDLSAYLQMLEAVYNPQKQEQQQEQQGEGKEEKEEKEDVY